MLQLLTIRLKIRKWIFFIIFTRLDTLFQVTSTNHTKNLSKFTQRILITYKNASSWQTFPTANRYILNLLNPHNTQHPKASTSSSHQKKLCISLVVSNFKVARDFITNTIIPYQSILYQNLYGRQQAFGIISMGSILCDLNSKNLHREYIKHVYLWDGVPLMRNLRARRITAKLNV